MTTDDATAGSAARPGGRFSRAKVSARGFDLAYTEAGSGPLVVMVHGSTGPEPSVGKDLLAQSLRVVEIEQPGFGEAPDDDRTTSYADLAVTIAAAVEALGVSRYHVVGSSMGGITAMELTRQFPDRVAGLVLEASMGFLGEAFARPSDEMWSFLRAYAEDPNAPGPPIPPSPRKPWEDDTYQRALFRRRLRVVLQERYYIPDFDEVLAAQLRELAVPATILYGAFDPFVIPGRLDTVAANYRRVLPDAEFVVLDRAGHDLQGEAPEAFADAVRGLILKHP